jgi:hypothetical protein
MRCSSFGDGRCNDGLHENNDGNGNDNDTIMITTMIMKITLKNTMMTVIMTMTVMLPKTPILAKVADVMVKNVSGGRW